MGVSRSTAAMRSLLAQTHADEDEERLFARLSEIRPQAWPNSLMVGFADAQLGRAGRLTDALRRHYGRRMRQEPAVESGRASCRERVCQYAKYSVVADKLKKKT